MRRELAGSANDTCSKTTLWPPHRHHFFHHFLFTHFPSSIHCSFLLFFSAFYISLARTNLVYPFDRIHPLAHILFPSLLLAEKAPLNHQHFAVKSYKSLRFLYCLKNGTRMCAFRRFEGGGSKLIIDVINPTDFVRWNWSHSDKAGPIERLFIYYIRFKLVWLHVGDRSDSTVSEI